MVAMGEGVYGVDQPVATVAFTESGGKVMASAQQTQKKSEANMSPVTWQEDEIF